MKTNIFAILFCAGLMLAVMSCENKNETIIPSKNISSQFVDIIEYSGLEIDATFQAEVSFSDSEELVEIIANDNLHPYLIVEKVSNVLKVRLRDNVNINGPATLKVKLTSGYLSSLSASGASNIILLDTLFTDHVQINVNGASKMDGPVSVHTVSADLDGASSLNLEGQANTFMLRASGASQTTDYSFSCDILDASLSGASEVRLTVHQSIDLSASSASTLYYRGEATINSQSLSGASSIVKTY